MFFGSSVPDHVGWWKSIGLWQMIVGYRIVPEHSKRFDPKNAFFAELAEGNEYGNSTFLPAVIQDQPTRG